MARTRTLDQFADVAAVLDAAIASGGALYTCSTPGSAIHWRQRAYELRKRLREVNAQTTPPGVGVSTKYDGVTIVIEKGSAVCRIELIRPKGQLTDLAGNPIDVTVARNVAGDPMVDEAAALLLELGDKDFDL